MAHVPGRFWLRGTGESALLACFVTEVSWEGNTQEVERHRKINRQSHRSRVEAEKAITTARQDNHSDLCWTSRQGLEVV